MANLVLGAAGAAIGGPVGGALGTMLGREVDRSLGRTSGARISDLRAPSSQYGDQVPAVVRRMRVAGVVLWTSQPVATATVSKSGSNQGSSVSFAYALSSGRIDQVGRIWADGRLIRDKEDRQDVAFEMRLYDGDEDQPSDPLIASILGASGAPAFRGIAYILFENFDLSSFGNRLPFITVEIDGDGEPVAAMQLIGSQLNLNTRQIEGEHVLEGYALAGDDIASAISLLCEAFEPAFAYGERGWNLEKSGNHHIIDDQLWTLNDAHQGMSTLGGNEIPTKVSVRYFDPALDFAAGEMSARLPGVERLRRIELPASLSGESAKAMAFERLCSGREKSNQTWLMLPLSYANICVGDEISCASEPETRFVVCAKALSSGQLKFALRRRPPPVASFGADAGARRGMIALAREPLALSLVEMPGSRGGSEPEVAILISGGHVPFERLPLSTSLNGIERTGLSAAMPCARGRLLEPLLVSSSELMDRRNTLVVEFGQDPYLTSCGEAALLAGANLCWLEGEFIQFQTAKPLGEGRYELTDLIRGRFDSRPEIAHESGSAIHALETNALTIVKLSHDSVGATFNVRVHGPENSTAEASLAIQGLAAKPWAPEHLLAAETATGLKATWARRCRQAAPWLDSVEAPVGASREVYRATLTDQDDRSLEVETSDPSALFEAQALQQLGPRPWLFEVAQLGDFAPGRKARLTID